jgi:hypothetical protein
VIRTRRQDHCDARFPASNWHWSARVSRWPRATRPATRLARHQQLGTTRRTSRVRGVCRSVRAPRSPRGRWLEMVPLVRASGAAFSASRNSAAPGIPSGWRCLTSASSCPAVIALKESKRSVIPTFTTARTRLPSDCCDPADRPPTACSNCGSRALNSASMGDDAQSVLALCS